jgi:uncharacterized protein YegJ (DUF2314 family)
MKQCLTLGDSPSGWSPDMMSMPAALLVAHAASIEIAYVLHFAPEPRGDVAKQAQELLRAKFPGTVDLAVLNMKEEGFGPPSVENLKYSGRGVTSAQAETLQTSTHAAALTFTYKHGDALTALNHANVVAHDLASRTNGLIWDVETRELFTPEAWKTRRLSAPNNGFPDVRNHITIHAYQSGDYFRAVTLGMEKFGQPDLVIDQFGWSLSKQMGNTINLVAQSLIEGVRLPAVGAWDFDVSKIKHAGVKAVYDNNLLEDAKPVATLTLIDAVPDEGDPENRLIELRFDRYDGETVHERNQRFASAFYGSVDTVSYITHNDAIRSASERARKRLPALRKAFNSGLPPGENLLLTAPFDTPSGGNEWMWVEVSSWKGNEIVGLLGNEPAEIPDLHAGATVKINEQDVFDYLLYKADGSEEGNETGKEIAKAQPR